jgi:DNA-nicking Smr family endonuclease
VIDLHLEALVPDADDTDVLRALDIQLEAFEQALNAAIRDGCREVVFIHGVGAGVLKKNLRQRLRQYAAVRQVLDDTSGKYGNGATRVLLHR